MAVPGKASITLVCGASGSGKTAWLIQRIRRAKRVLVWDMKGEYARDHGFALLSDKSQLVDALRRSKVGRFAFRSIVPADFDFFCRAAYAWGKCIVIAEELADVTTPGKAPLGWGMVVRRGRDRSLEVYGVTQRPAESDKTVIGNATLIHCAMLPRFADRQYMAREMDIDVEKIAALKPLEWVERAGMETLKGRVVF